MTVRNWFDNCVTLKWWIFENIITEKSQEIKITEQFIKNYDTVEGNYGGTGDYDFYTFSLIDFIDSIVKNLPIDLYVYFYTEDKEFIKNSVVIATTLPVKTSINKIQTVTPIFIDEYEAYKYGDGYIFYIGIYDLYQKRPDLKMGTRLSVMVTSNNDNPGDYYIYVMVTNETNHRKN